MCRLIPFGVLDGREIPLIELSDGRCAMELLPYGAAIRALRVPDREGRMTDICLGYDDVESYRALDACLGGTIGRCANRIGGAQFTIDGTTYHVTANEGENCLHGGVEGFHKKLWDFTCAEDAVTFTYISPDGEEGFPGTVRVEVTYRLADGTLTIEYRAAAEKDTVVNLTNHAYFNLGGHDSGEVGGHVLTVRADRYTPTDSGNVPTGTLASVEGTLLDLRTPTALESRLHDGAFNGGRGYDHNYVLSGGEQPASELWCPATGIALAMTTSMEGMQLYTAGWLTERVGKDGAVYGPAQGVCLETQHFPNAVNCPAFPSPILRAGETLRQWTTFRFFTR